MGKPTPRFSTTVQSLHTLTHSHDVILMYFYGNFTLVALCVMAMINPPLYVRTQQFSACVNTGLLDRVLHASMVQVL